MNRGRLYLCLLLPMLFGLVSCAASIEPYTATESIQQSNRNDARLWGLADKFDEEISHTDRIYHDEDLQDYLQSIVNRLYPEFKGTLHIQVLKSSSLNAFALPNGSIYIHTGLLSRCENEAQAATILGHESAHFVDRHSLRQREYMQNSTALANILTLSGIPLVGPILSVSSIFGYSRDMERTADRMAYDRLLMTGYDTRESLKIFRHLADETEINDEKEPFFFSTHPRMVERVESIDEMLVAKPSSNGDVGEEVFLLKTEKVRIAALEEALSMNKYKSLIYLLETDDRPSGYPQYYKYYLGEAYRQRGEDGDQERAFTAYNETIDSAPEFAPAYRAIGLYYLKQKDNENAKDYLNTYLQKVPGAKDREYIRYYIDNLEKGDGL